MTRWIAGLAVLAGCGGPGACEESVREEGVRFGFCFEVEHSSQCPVFESGDASDEYQWEFRPNQGCDPVAYPFDCGGGIWEDIEAECAGWKD